MGWVVNATPWPLYLWTQDLVPIVQEARWAPEPVWLGGENLAQARLQSLITATFTQFRQQ
jgi:hypothetical protein